MSAPENQPGKGHTQPRVPRAAQSPGAFSDRGGVGGAGGTHPSAATGPGAIHAPWRLAYLEGLAEGEAGTAPGAAKKGAGGSFLAEYWADAGGDERNHVIVRTGQGMILLNAYPYATGHLLVALGEPRPSLTDYTPAQRATLWRLTDCAAALIEAAFGPQGINIGINQGRAAGAGVPGHLHVHLVPRWAGDVNFISVVGQVRVIPASLETAAARYRRAWEKIRGAWPLDP